MADKSTQVPESDTAVEAAAVKRGRPKGPERDPNGRSISAFFTEDEFKAIDEASFEKRHRKLTDLVRAAVFEYVGYTPKA